MSRETVLHKVRSALGRTPGQTPEVAPPPILVSRTMDVEARVSLFIERFEALAGKALRVPNPAAARIWLEQFLNQRTAVASNSPYLGPCVDLPNVQRGNVDRAAVSTANVGITSVDYALAETGTMVLFSSAHEARLISLLPPVHVAIFPKSSILVGLDELFTLLPLPAEMTSAMVMITGPSRTADIEQILVRGVHGPGEIYALVVDE
jgi:L-lactate dehydrogenase complex protein LldG